jgi:hypothetical protein
MLFIYHRDMDTKTIRDMERGRDTGTYTDREMDEDRGDGRDWTGKGTGIWDTYRDGVMNMEIL